MGESLPQCFLSIYENKILLFYDITENVMMCKGGKLMKKGTAYCRLVFLLEISGNLRARRKVSQPCVGQRLIANNFVQACSREPLRIQCFERYLSPTPNEKRKAFCLPLVGGGDKRIRTAGLLVANEALYQLSHIPIDKIYYKSIFIFCQEIFVRYLKKYFL